MKKHLPYIMEDLLHAKHLFVMVDETPMPKSLKVELETLITLAATVVSMGEDESISPRMDLEEFLR